MRERVLKLFHHRCPHCFEVTNEVHEIESKAGIGYARATSDINNRIPLCLELHRRVTQEGPRVWADRLRQFRQRGLEYWKK